MKGLILVLTAIGLISFSVSAEITQEMTWDELAKITDFFQRNNVELPPIIGVTLCNNLTVNGRPVAAKSSPGSSTILLNPGWGIDYLRHHLAHEVSHQALYCIWEKKVILVLNREGICEWTAVQYDISQGVNPARARDMVPEEYFAEFQAIQSKGYPNVRGAFYSAESSAPINLRMVENP